MKKLLLGALLLLSIFGYGQVRSSYLKFESEQQKKSILEDVLSLGFIKYECDTGEKNYIKISSDKTFCLFSEDMYKKINPVLLNSFSLRSDLLDIDIDKDYKPKITSLNNYFIKTDKFTGEKLYSGGQYNLSVSKYISKNSISKQYVSVSVNGSTLNYGCYGLIILFDNGKKLIRPKEKVDTNYNNDGWKYSVFFTPNNNEILLLQKYNIVSVKLYIYDYDIDEKTSTEFKDAVRILLKIK